MSVTMFGSDHIVHIPLFSRILIQSLNAGDRIAENWTPAQKGRPDWVEGGNPLASRSLHSLLSCA